MTTPSSHSYFIDQERSDEMVRLNEQHSYLRRSMEELFPRGLDLTHTRTLLDIACGPGGWALDVVKEYPHMHVTGIDISKRMIEYAQAQAQVKHSLNVSFQIMNALEAPLAFPDASFDMINARFIVGFMPTYAWDILVQECFRLLRPGGILSFTEADTSTIVGSPALVKHGDMVAEALWKNGQGFMPERTMGVTPMLSAFLQRGKFETIRQVAYPIDFSHGTPAHHDVLADFLSSLALLAPFYVKNGILAKDEIDAIYDQILQETKSEDFRGIWYVLTVFGLKP